MSMRLDFSSVRQKKKENTSEFKLDFSKVGETSSSVAPVVSSTVPKLGMGDLRVMEEKLNPLAREGQQILRAATPEETIKPIVPSNPLGKLAWGLLNAVPNAAISAAAEEAMQKKQGINTWSLPAIKESGKAFVSGLKGEQKVTGEQLLALEGMKPGALRNLAGGALETLLVPVFGGITGIGGKAASKIANPLLKKATGAAISGGLYGTGEAVAEGVPTKEIPAETVKNALMFAGTELGLGALGTVAKKAGKGLGSLVKRAEPTVETAEKPSMLAIPEQQITDTGLSTTVQVPEAKIGAKTETESIIPGSTEEVKLTDIKDISGFQAYTRDVYRNFRDAFGKKYEAVKKAVLDPLDDSKLQNIRFQKDVLTDLKTNVVDKLGIKKGSKLSALVQQYGEGQITLDQLKQQRPNDWQKIVEADNWFREKYDQLLDQVNASRKEIYPNAEQNVKKLEEQIATVRTDKTLSSAERNSEIKTLEDKLEDAMRGKIIPKREDYYRHFQEMGEGFKGIYNIFDTPSGISPGLTGISPFTKPKSKWLSFAQKRLGGEFKNDAVGGFLEYLPSASYAVHIDPNISKFRNLASNLREAAGKDSTNFPASFVEYLEEYANDLAGKTNPADRVIQRIIPGGRTTFRAINWLNNRIKANTILGNASSTLAQFANIPQGIAFAKQHTVRGMGRTLKSIFAPDAARAESGFMTERYGRRMYSQFDQKFLQQPVKFAEWMMETADRIGTEFIWQSAYSKGLAGKVANPVRYADNATRALVAGRGIGEVPLLQKAKVFQLIAPFQLEVGNLWHVMGDMAKTKDIGGLMTLAVASFLFNRAMEQVRGSGVTFDPIQAIIEASQEDTAVKGLGRLAGEILSNVPLGQTIASAYPEYGTTILGKQLPTREEFFGREDPTRFGTGPLFIKSLKLNRLLFPAGGLQLEKTYKGLGALAKGGVTTKKGQLKYPVSPDDTNALKGLLFGTSGFREALPYYQKELQPLSEKQTEQVMRSSDKEKTYNRIQLERARDRIDKELGELAKDRTLTAAERQKKRTELMKKRRELK